MDIGCCYSINIGCLLQNYNNHSFVHSLNVEIEPPLNITPRSVPDCALVNHVRNQPAKQHIGP